MTYRTSRPSIRFASSLSMFQKTHYQFMPSLKFSLHKLSLMLLNLLICFIYNPDWLFEYLNSLSHSPQILVNINLNQVCQLDYYSLLMIDLMASLINGLENLILDLLYTHVQTATKDSMVMGQVSQCFQLGCLAQTILPVPLSV
jgi:hypothetical protein